MYALLENMKPFNYDGSHCIYDGDHEARICLDIWACSDERCRLEHD